MQLKVFLLITDETTAAMAAAEVAAAATEAAVVTAVAAVAAMGAAGRNVPFLVSTVQYTLPGTILDMVILISVSDPDPGSIGQWIRIRIRILEGKNDPQK